MIRYDRWEMVRHLPRVHFSSYVSTNRRISLCLDHPHLPFLACPPNPSWTFRIWKVIVTVPLLKKFSIYPSVNSKCPTWTWRTWNYITFNGDIIRLATIYTNKIWILWGCVFVHVFWRHKKFQGYDILAVGVIWAKLKHGEAWFSKKGDFKGGPHTVQC